MNYKTDWSIVDDLISNFEQYIKENHKVHPDIELYSFPQTWGSTALGFGGIGGQAVTTAQTIVLYDLNLNIARVYFGSTLAYQIDNPTQQFFTDLQDWRMNEVSRSSVYRRKVNDK